MQNTFIYESLSGIIIGSGNDLSPVQCSAIIWTYNLFGRTNFSKYKNFFRNIRLKFSSII